MVQLVNCPNCHSQLKVTTANAFCNNCNCNWRVKNDIIDMLSDHDYNYEYEYSKEDMKSLLVLAKDKGWFDAINFISNVFGDEWKQYFIDYNISSQRAPWLARIANKDSVILDYGCGFGAISCIAANIGNSVLSVDASFDRLEFWRIRARQEGINNVVFLAWDGCSASPIPENTFDLIILNGVLEWIPESIKDIDPYLVQLNFLRECKKYLNEKGKLVLAIENRFALRYFLGSPDHHSELLYATLMPRYLSDIYSRIVRKRPYRVYTYSLKKYLSMFKIAGYENIEKYEIFPLYQFPKIIIDLNDEQEICNIRAEQIEFEHRLLRIMAKFGVAKHFVFTYLFIASKKD